MTEKTIKILLVDDEPNIVELNKLYLESEKSEQYEVVTAYDGLEALTQFRTEDPDIVILDVMMPEVDGWGVCKSIRQDSQVPIIMLTARVEDHDKIVGLEMGADDYMAKPFNPRELLARIRAVLRRVHEPNRPVEAPIESIEVGNLALFTERREVTVNNRTLQLRGKEFDLLYYLLQNQRLALSRDKILDKVWGYDYYGETRTVDVHVAQLRKELNDSNVKIETVWSVGYKLIVE